MIESLAKAKAVARELDLGLTDAEIEAMWKRRVLITEIVDLAEDAPWLAGRCIYAALFIERGRDPVPIMADLKARANGGRPALRALPTASEDVVESRPWTTAAGSG